MAKRIVDEEMRFSVIINGDEAQKELFDLEKATRKLTSENKALKAEKTRLKALGKEETEEYKKLSASIKENSAVIKNNEDRMTALRGKIGITSLTMKQLKQEASQLRVQLQNMTPGSAEYVRLDGNLRKINARIKELSLNSRVAESSVSRLAQGFNKYFILATSVIAAGTGVVFSLQRLIDFNGKLSDSQSDVMKTTQMTREEVDELSKSFGMMKTRTSRIELLKLAEQAGRLGITGVKNLQDFVASANEIKVALGDDLSEEAIQEIGKITNIYKVGEQTGKDYAASLTAVGSAINEVSAAGANQAGYLVDYLKRQAGIATQARISADANIGYAATFDEIGQNVEVTATAMNKVWMDLFENTGTYADIAGMSLVDFKNLLEKDANEAMITFLEGLNGNNEGLAVMVEKLKDLEVGGARGAQALSALSGNTDLLRERQKLAKTALTEATSVTNEYNLKNNNLAATLEKVEKKLIGIFTSDFVIKSLASIVDWIAKFIGATEDAEGSVTRFRDRLVFAVKVILAAVISLLSYNAALKLSIFFTTSATQATTLYSVVNGIAAAKSTFLKGATILLNAAYLALTGNITRATAAMRLFNMVTKLNPVGLLLAILASAATAFYLFRDRAEKAAGSLNKLNSELEVSKEISAELSKSFAKEATQLKSSIEPLIRILESQNTSLETRKKAYEELIRIAPQFRDTVDKEFRATSKLRDVYRDILDQMQKRLRAQAQEQVLKKYYDQEAESLNKVYEARKKLESFKAENKSDPYYKLKFGDEEAELVREYNDAVKEYNITLSNTREIEDYRQRQIEVLTQRQKEYAEGSKEFIEIQNQINSLLGVTGQPNVNDTVEPTITPNSPGGTSANNEEIDFAKLYADRNRLRIEAMQEGFEKEKQLEQYNFNEKLKSLEAQKVSLENLDTQIEKARLAGNVQLYNSLLKTRKVYEEKNAVIDQQIYFEQELHLDRLGTLIEQSLIDQVENKQNLFDREAIQRQIAHNEEMAALGNNKEARKALQEKFNREEAEREVKHLQDLIVEMKTIMDGGEFQGFNLELLSEEEAQQIRDRIAAINLELSKLLNKSGDEDDLTAGPRIDGGVDILGFTIDQWTETFENLDTAAQKIKAAQMAVGAMMNAWSMYSDFMNQRERRDLQNFERAQDQRQQTLQRQLDRGFINQRQYNMAVDAMEKESQRKRAEMEYKQAKREKEMTMANIVLNTAMGVAKAVAQSPLTFGMPWAAVVAAIGAAQLVMAASVPLPAKGFEEGLYPVRREQDGKVFNARNGGNLKSGLVSKPTILVAEKDPEMIIDGPAWKRMDPDVKNSLYRELGRMGRMPGYQEGYYKEDRTSEPSGEKTSSDYSLFIAALNRNSAVMERIEREGVRAILKRTMENAQALKEDMDDYEDWYNSNKV